MLTLKASFEIGTNPGYDTLNTSTKDIGEVAEQVKKSANKVQEDVGIYVSAVVSGPNRTCYKDEWGCPEGGEPIFTVSSVANPAFAPDLNLWKKATLLLANDMRNELQQSTVTVEMTGEKGPEIFYINSDEAVIDFIKEIDCNGFKHETIVEPSDIFTDAEVQKKFYLDSGLFDNEQLSEITAGITSGLSNRQIDVFATPEFDADQMHEIRKGLEKGLSPDQIKMYADTKYDWFQMQQVRWGLQHGLTQDQINVYSDPVFSGEKMYAIREGLEQNISKEQAIFMANPAFNRLQIDQICRGILNCLTEDKIKFFADPEFSEYQMEQIRRGFEKGLSFDAVNIYAKPELSGSQMLQIRLGIEHKLTPEQIAVFADYKYDSNQMEIMRNMLENGMNIYHPKLEAEQDENNPTDALDASSSLDKIISEKAEMAKEANKRSDKSEISKDDNCIN